MTRTYCVLIGAAVAGLVCLAVPAAAKSAKPTFDFYGHLNLGVLHIDNGARSSTAFTDNNNSNSRVGLNYAQPLDNGGQFRLRFETALGFTGSNIITARDNEFDVNFARTELRHFEAIYVTPNIGTFSFGQGSIATDGFAEADLSGTAFIAYSSLQDQAGNQEFQLPSGGGSGITVGSGFNGFDSGRLFRLGYDTPRYKGFTLGVTAAREILTSGVDDEFYDIGLKFDRDYGDYRVAGRIGYSVIGTTEELILGSFAVLHEPTGLNLSFASGRTLQDDDRYFFIKGGIVRDFFDFGSSHFTIDFYSGENFNTTGSESLSIGLTVVQRVKDLKLELFATYRTFDFDEPGVALLDQDLTFVGARWSF